MNRQGISSTSCRSALANRHRRDGGCRVIIMIETRTSTWERDRGKKPHWDIIRDAAVEVGPTRCSIRCW